jgi:hypothetical protein
MSHELEAMIPRLLNQNQSATNGRLDHRVVGVTGPGTPLPTLDRHQLTMV